MPYTHNDCPNSWHQKETNVPANDIWRFDANEIIAKTFG